MLAGAAGGARRRFDAAATLAAELKRRGAEEPIPSTPAEVRASPLLTEVRSREQQRLPAGGRAWFDPPP